MQRVQDLARFRQTYVFAGRSHRLASSRATDLSEPARIVPVPSAHHRSKEGEFWSGGLPKPYLIQFSGKPHTRHGTDFSKQLVILIAGGCARIPLDPLIKSPPRLSMNTVT